MFDPKPDAPAEIQGEMKSIATCIPGLRIGEGIPELAKIMDRLTVVRSVTHPYPGTWRGLRGKRHSHLHPGPRNRARGAAPIGRSSGRWWILSKSRRSNGSIPVVPRNVGLPWLLNSKTDLNVSAGPYAAFLGQGYDPVWTDYDGPGTKIAPHYTDGQKKDFSDPFAETPLSGRFKVSTLANQADDLPDARLTARQSLVKQFDGVRQQMTVSKNDGFDRHRRQAFAMLTSEKDAASILDLEREPLNVREKSLWADLVWPGLPGGPPARRSRQQIHHRCLGWIRPIRRVRLGHAQQPLSALPSRSICSPDLQPRFLPGALIRDLESRGLLDDTLVLWMSEHGRTPRIDSETERGQGGITGPRPIPS